ncbi:MAG TPA: hypothetical protein DCR04_09855 [Flavobacteriales bacterium]|nr:hypothetical protein [Flavobacteriales bacterium]
MGKPKKKHKGQPHAKAKEIPSEPKKPGFLKRLAKNVAILICVLFVLNWLKTNNPGYKWVVESQVIKSQKNLEKYKDLTEQQKLEAKLGFSVRYFDFIERTRLTRPSFFFRQIL